MSSFPPKTQTYAFHQKSQSTQSLISSTPGAGHDSVFCSRAFHKRWLYFGSNIWHSNQEMVLLNTKPYIPAAPVWLIKNIWHIQVIQLSLMPVSRGSFQDPWGREVFASRIQNQPEVQLNRAAQQLAVLSRDLNIYFLWWYSIWDSAHTHTLAVLHGFAITIAIVWGKQRRVHTLAHILVELVQFGKTPLNGVHNVCC